MKVPVTQVRASGGGARSPLWRQILADVFAVPLVTVTTTEGAAYGAALLAGVGCGVFTLVEAACDAVVAVRDSTVPDLASVGIYRKLYELSTAAYPSLRSAMHNFSMWV